MAKKIAINVFYNLGMIVSVFGMAWVFNQNWLIVAFFAATFAAFLYFKIQLVKDFKKEIEKRK